MPESSESLTTAQRAVRWLEDYWIEIAMGLLPIALALSMALMTRDFAELLSSEARDQALIRQAGLALTAAVVAFNCFVLYRHCQSKARQSHLEKQIASLQEERTHTLQDVRSLAAAYVLAIAKGPLKFGTRGTHCERITLYGHDSNGSFIPLGRFSYNPRFDTQGRPFYPDNQGCIAKAWEHGWHFAADFPDPEQQPARYLTRCGRDGICRETAEAFRMKSRLFCGVAITDPTEVRKLAVLIVESTEPDRYTEEELRAILTDSERQYLRNLMISLSPRMPDRAAARRLGF